MTRADTTTRRDDLPAMERPLTGLQEFAAALLTGLLFLAVLLLGIFHA